jgi:threonine dehydrogenase-like Zn-dependent dehydrogenase
VSVLTEPMAVAWHAVRRGDVRKRDVSIVIGCGPIGLAVILMLKAKGVDPRPLLTGVVGLDGVGEAFAELGNPERHAKIVIDPSSDASGVRRVGAETQLQAAVV